MNLSTIRAAHRAASRRWDASCAAYDAAINDCAAEYTEAKWTALGEAEQAHRAAGSNLDRAVADLDHAELLAVGVRRVKSAI